jgi:hypothetical protein
VATVRSELRSELAALARGDFSQKHPVTAVAPVTQRPVSGNKSLKLHMLPELLIKKISAEMLQKGR